MRRKTKPSKDTSADGNRISSANGMTLRDVHQKPKYNQITQRCRAIQPPLSYAAQFIRSAFRFKPPPTRAHFHAFKCQLSRGRVSCHLKPDVYPAAGSHYECETVISRRGKLFWRSTSASVILSGLFSATVGGNTVRQTHAVPEAHVRTGGEIKFQ